MDNKERLSILSDLVAIMEKSGNGSFAAQKLEDCLGDLLRGIAQMARGKSVWPDPDWEAVKAELRARNPSDPSIPLPKNIADHEGLGDE